VPIASVAGPGVPESGYEPSAITHDAQLKPSSLELGSDDQVHVIHGAVQRVNLDVLDGGLYGLAFDVQNQLNTAVANGQGGFACWKQYVLWLGACTVDNCWDLAVAASLASSALAEIATYNGVKVDRCHDNSP